MTSEACVFNDQQSFLNAFSPARSHKGRKEDAGRWLRAHREPEQQKNRNLQRRMEETRWKSSDKEASTPGGITLDGRFLLRLHCVDEPSQLCSVDVSEQRLNSVEPEELKAFINVAYVDASDNFLSLGLFSCFSSLRELNLSFNRITRMLFDAAEFPHLEVLDLSFNSLSGEDLLLLGQIPRLKTLHLTGNRLHSLPPDFASSHSDRSDLLPKDGAKNFEALEVLMLDDNRLTSRVFYSLINLKRLKHLNLEGNHISEIPCMEVMESSKPGRISALRQREEEAHTRSKIDHHFEIIEFLHTVREDGCRGSRLLLPELRRLILADNKITSEEALAAAALFPKLCELDIHSNPLITKKRDSSLLTHYLQEKLGIKIKRKKAEDFVKLQQKVSTYPGWKLDENTPKLTQMRIMLDALCVRHTQGNKSKQSGRRAIRSEDKNKRKCQENAKYFFITQAEDEAEPQHDSSSNPNASAQSKQGNRTNPGQSTCYDIIMDAKPNPYIGIQTAVQMLERTLRNPNVYRDSKPRLDSMQTPYRGMKKRIQELPPLRPITQPIQRADELIKEIKGSRTVKTVALGSAMHGRGVNREDYKEALFLLRDMKKKHRIVHEKTVQQQARGQFEQYGAEHSPL